MKYGYSDNSIDTIPGVDKMFTDDVNKIYKSRPNLAKLLNQIGDGDTLVVKSLGCLSWGTRDVVLMLQKLMKVGANIISINDAIDTSNQSYVAHIVTAFHEIELYRFLKTKNYTKSGSKPKEVNENLWNAYYTLWKNKSIKKVEWAKQMNMNLMTFNRTFKKRHPTEIRPIQCWRLKKQL